ncbi:MAG: molybdopterin-binding protein [Proteobacteria bacterium]|nr:molybdopterin-binding protein [Pseudomonadota bacterium]
MTGSISRRNWLRAGLASAGGLALAACDRITNSPTGNKAISSAEGLTRRAQRLLIDRKALAREFQLSDISADFKPNGSIDPQDPDYLTLKAKGFADYRLVVDGLVERPLSLSLADLKALPSRTQITRHDCVEGWSSIAKWQGAKLAPILDQAGLKPNARYIVFHCFDTLDGPMDGAGRYYESVDLLDAHHPQTILAYAMNDRPLPVAHGAPLRLRVERQLGYKQAKYIQRIEAVADYTHLHHGGGGFWEDRGYEWYAGI